MKTRVRVAVVEAPIEVPAEGDEGAYLVRTRGRAVLLYCNGLHRRDYYVWVDDHWQCATGARYTVMYRALQPVRERAYAYNMATAMRDPNAWTAST